MQIQAVSFSCKGPLSPHSVSSHESPLLPVQEGFNVPIDPGLVVWETLYLFGRNNALLTETDVVSDAMGKSIYVLTVNPLKHVPVC